jgi:hypothetical protein
MLIASINKMRPFFLIFLLFLLTLTIFLIAKAHSGGATVTGALLGVMLAYGLNREYSEQRRENEYRSLLISFVHELEEDYHRCVLYHKQRQEGIISFSAIFDFNDASTLSKLASVTANSKIVDAIMYLKKVYFQVGRHVENASKFATELESIKSKIRKLAVSPEDQAEIRMLQIKASKAQDTALAFFIGVDKDNTTYPKIVDSTLLLITELRERWAEVAKEFELEFKDDRDALKSIEDEKRQALAEEKKKKVSS